MNFIRTEIPDVVIIEPQVHGDDRGYFVETFRADKLEAFLGYKINYKGVSILPLFARLASKDQQKIFSKGPLRKIIVSTNVAETSLTIPGIKYVVDTGLARIPSYSPRTRTTSLPVKKISRSSSSFHHCVKS